MAFDDGLLVTDFEVAHGEFLSTTTGEVGEVITISMNRNGPEDQALHVGLSRYAAMHLSFALLGAVLSAVQQDMVAEEGEAGFADPLS